MLAVVTLEHAEASMSGPKGGVLAARASDNFERLGAMPWLRRARAVERTGAAA